MLGFIDKEIGSLRATLDPFLVCEHEPKIPKTNYQRVLVLRHALGFKGHIN
jgi:hypothetical protein